MAERSWCAWLACRGLTRRADGRTSRPSLTAELSLPTPSVYWASSRQWPVSGDAELKPCQAEGTCSGVLWVTDQLFDASHEAAVLGGLKAIAAHPRCRLPGVEIQFG